MCGPEDWDVTEGIPVDPLHEDIDDKQLGDTPSPDDLLEDDPYAD